MWPFKNMSNSELPINPYITGDVVGNTSAFVGREDLLQDIRNVLQHSQRNAIVLYGQRRIGKTSILIELEAKLKDEGYLPIYFTLEDKGKFPLEKVIQELANKISDKLNAQSQLALEDILSNWQSSQKLVILFDEFEAFAGNEPDERQASETFFPYWRDIISKVNKTRLNFVFTIGRQVEDLNQKAMSLLKAISSKKVSLFDLDATVRLIKLSDSKENKTLKWDEKAIKAVWTQTGGHPYMTQILCSCIWETLCIPYPRIKPTVRVTDVNEELLLRVLETGKNAFQWLWEGLPATERLVTSILASTGNKPITAQSLELLLKDNGVKIANPDQQQTTIVLQDWDIIEPVGKDKDKFRFRVELFRRWIAQNKLLPKVQLELESSEYQAHNFYQAGYQLLVIDKLDLAIENLEKAIKLNPNHVSATSLLIDIYLGKGNWEKAWKTAKALSLLRPKDARPLLTESLEGLIADQDEETQLRYYEETLEIDPEHTYIKEKWQNILKQKGDEAYETGKLEQALKIYQKAELSDKIAMVEGDIAYKAGYLEKALEAYQKAELGDKIAMVEGYIAYKTGDLEKALEAYQKAGLNDKVTFIEQIIKHGIEMITIPKDGIKIAYDFQISKCPITISQYKKYRKSKGYSEDIRDNENREDDNSIINISYIDSDGGEFYPDIYHYLEWLKQEDQIEYRLPTKEEWFYAKENGLIETVSDLYEWTSSSFNDNNEILELVSVNLEDDWSYLDTIKDNSTFRIIKKLGNFSSE
jgi:tetratricopeptide (TPR) repeat protein